MNNIRVYSGEGSSRMGSSILIEELQKHLPQVPVSPITESEMRKSGRWKHDTSLLVFSAASVGMFKKALGETVLEDIRRGVYHGAFDYMGICAGACFGANDITYRMKPVTSSETIFLKGEGLGFFNGLVDGPHRKITSLPFSGESENIELITLCDMQDLKEYKAFFWGGPELIPLQHGWPNGGRILSMLQGGKQFMSCTVKYGKGNVTLSAFHPELTAKNIVQWADFRELPDHEIRRLQTAAAKLDGTAMPRFLRGAGLLPVQAMKKAVDRSTAFSLNL